MGIAKNQSMILRVFLKHMMTIMFCFITDVQNITYSSIMTDIISVSHIGVMPLTETFLIFFLNLHLSTSLENVSWRNLFFSSFPSTQYKTIPMLGSQSDISGYRLIREGVIFHSRTWILVIRARPEILPLLVKTMQSFQPYQDQTR